MRRGQEYTDYVNASFIDVSILYFLICSFWGFKVFVLTQIIVPMKLYIILIKSFIFWFDSGLQTQGLLHCHTGPSAAHSGGFLENGVGVEMSLHGHAHWAPGEGAGKLQ